MPLVYQDFDTDCDRKGRFGRIRFIPQDVMGTTISGSEEVFRIRYIKGLCEFSLTGTYTMRLLTLSFKTLAADWQIIVAPNASRDATTIVEALT
jgi:hypothetical protein